MKLCKHRLFIVYLIGLIIYICELEGNFVGLESECGETRRTNLHVTYWLPDQSTCMSFLQTYSTPNSIQQVFVYRV